MSIQDDKTFSFYTENYTCYFDTVSVDSREEALALEGTEVEENERDLLTAEITVKSLLGLDEGVAIFRVEMFRVNVAAVNKLMELFQ